MLTFTPTPTGGVGELPAPARRRRRSSEPGHGPKCSPNPEVGCVCGRAEREDAERVPQRLGLVERRVTRPNLSHPSVTMDVAS